MTQLKTRAQTALTPKQCAEQFRMYARASDDKPDVVHQLNFCADFLDEFCVANPARRDIADRFWFSVSKPSKPTDACWVWCGGGDSSGYGHIGNNGQTHLVHRLSWMLHYGDIPGDLCVLHKCDNRQCVRPDHLWLGTVADNNRDAFEKGRRTLPIRKKARKL